MGPSLPMAMSESEEASQACDDKPLYVDSLPY